MVKRLDSLDTAKVHAHGYTSLVELWLKNLQSLGWINWEKDADGVFKNKIIINPPISFNENTFNENFLKAEREHFWAQHRSQIILQTLNSLKVEQIWEIGAGNGNVAITLKNKGIDVIAVEPLELGCKVLSANGMTVFNSTLEQLELPECSINAIGMFDLLGHVYDVDGLLIEAKRVLEIGGYLLLLLPAYEWMYSDYDLAIKQLQRFNQKKILKLLKSNNFDIIISRYLFSFLLIPAIFLRLIPYKLGRRLSFDTYEKQNAKLLNMDKIFGKVIRFLTRCETHVNPGFGLSIFIVARKIPQRT